MFSLIAKLTLPIVAIIALALGLMVLLSYVKFERTFAELTRTRLGVVLQNVRTTLETGLDLGLELHTLVNAQAVLERAVNEEPHILALLIFDHQHRLLFSSLSTAVIRALQSTPSPNHPYADLAPTHLPAAWQPQGNRTVRLPVEAIHDPGRDNLPVTLWHSLQTADLALGIPITNNFGQRVGTLVLRYDGVFYLQTLRDALRHIGYAAVLLALLLSGIALVGVALIVRPHHRQLQRVRQALNTALTQPHSPPFQPRPGAVLEAHYAAAEQRSRIVQQRLAALGRVIQLEAQQLQAPTLQVPQRPELPPSPRQDRDDFTEGS